MNTRDQRIFEAWEDIVKELDFLRDLRNKVVAKEIRPEQLVQDIERAMKRVDNAGGVLRECYSGKIMPDSLSGSR